MHKYITYTLLILVVILAVALVRDRYQPPKVVEVFQPAPPPKEVVKYETLVLKCSEEPELRIVYVDKPAAAHDNYVPESVKDDEDKLITAIAEVPAHKGKTTVIASFDMGTGRTSLDFRQERPRALGFENIKELGLRYGVGSSGTAGALYGRYTFFRIFGVLTAVYGEANTDFSGDMEALAMLDIRYEW